MRLLLIILAGIAMLTGCSQKIETAAEKEKMLQRDRDFSARSVATNTAQAFNEFIAEDGIAFSFEPPLIGNKLIAQNMPSDSSFVLSWEPDFAEISVNGDMGYTSGIYISRQTGRNGEISEGKGRYLTVWQKIDSVWMAIADIGTTLD
ncbi:YybH family protein [Candidatus Cloacimonadota bacterium]